MNNWHAQHVRQSLQQRTQITLAELLQTRPLEHGLAELVTYLSLAAEPRLGTALQQSSNLQSWFRAAIDDTQHDTVVWREYLDSLSIR